AVGFPARGAVGDDEKQLLVARSALCFEPVGLAPVLEHGRAQVWLVRDVAEHAAYRHGGARRVVVEPGLHAPVRIVGKVVQAPELRAGFAARPAGAHGQPAVALKNLEAYVGGLDPDRFVAAGLDEHAGHAGASVDADLIGGGLETRPGALDDQLAPVI